MKKGGIVEHVAETAQTIVMSVPRSPYVRKPTCLYPFRATTLSGFRTVVTSVSSMLHMSFSLNLLRDRTVWRLSKKGTNICFIRTAGVCMAERQNRVSLKKGSDPIYSGLLLFILLTRQNHVIFRCKLIR